MEANNWIIDGIERKTSQGAHVHFEDERYFSIEWEGKTFFGEILEESSEDRFLRIKINQREFHVKKKGALDELIASLGLDVPKVRKLKELVAPMPGRIVSVAVSEGDEVQPGDEILSLEAMKMENVLKAEGSGTVKEIRVKPNDVVDKGAVMIEFS